MDLWWSYYYVGSIEGPVTVICVNDFDVDVAGSDAGWRRIVRRSLPRQIRYEFLQAIM